MTKRSESRYAAGSTDIEFFAKLKDFARQIALNISRDFVVESGVYGSVSFDISSIKDLGVSSLIFVNSSVASFSGQLEKSNNMKIYLNTHPYLDYSQFREIQSWRRVRVLRQLIDPIDGPLYATLLHEISHAVRYKKSSKALWNPKKTLNMDPQKWVESYLRTPAEIDAYFVTSVAPLWEQYNNQVETYKKLFEVFSNPASTAEARSKSSSTIRGYLARQGKDAQRLIALLPHLTNAQQTEYAKLLSRQEFLGVNVKDFLKNILPSFLLKVEKPPQDVMKRWIKRATQFYTHISQSA